MLSFLKGKKDKDKHGRKIPAGPHDQQYIEDDYSHHELKEGDEESDGVVRPGTVSSLVNQFATPPIPGRSIPASALKSPVEKQPKSGKLKSILRGGGIFHLSMYTLC